MYPDCRPAIEELRAAGAVAEFASARIGLEKESLRVDRDGYISQQRHPRALGSALTHPYITTDFSEALLEFVTPPFEDGAETLHFLSLIHQFTYLHLDSELLWCASMPCMVRGDAAVPIAEYGRSNVGRMKRVYREGLSHRYGRTMQTIAGIHFNYSLPEAAWKVRSRRARGPSLQARIDDGYFACVRNFLRYGWLVPYLFGSSPAVCKSFLGGRTDGLETLDNGTAFLPYATSLRMSDIGYKNSTQASLRIDYSGVAGYVDSLTRAIETPHPPYAEIGVEVDGHHRQLNANLLQIENEFYSFIRPKQIARSGEKPTLALKRRGVRYVEVRALDVSPFEPLGISASTMRFVEALVVACALAESPPFDDATRARAERNQALVATRGRDPALEVEIAGTTRPLRDHAHALVEAIAPVCWMLDEAHGGTDYRAALAEQRAAIEDPRRLPSARVLDELSTRGVPFFRFAMDMSTRHRDHFRSLRLSSAQRQMFEEEAARSLAQQREIEAADQIDFAEYLRRYFAQSFDDRERALG